MANNDSTDGDSANATEAVVETEIHIEMDINVAIEPQSMVSHSFSSDFAEQQ